MKKADLREYRVLVIGDVMLDKYLIAKEMRRSPEGDFPLVYNYKTEFRAGGAANVAINLSDLGIRPFLIGLAASDQEGSILREICTYKGVDFKILSERDRCTTVKTRIVDPSFDQLIRFDKEDTHDITLATEKEIIREIRSVISDHGPDAVLIQDYNKGFCTKGLIEFVREICKKEYLPLISDPKVKNFFLLSGSRVFKPNLKELSQALGRSIRPEKNELDNAIKELGLPKDCLIFVTLADKGIYYQNFEQSGIVKGIEVDQPDVSGAGDTVISALTRAYLDRKDIRQMAKLANKAGAIVCRKKGVSSVSYGELEN